MVGRPFPPKLCQPGRTLLCGGVLFNRPFSAPFAARPLPPFENGRVVCVSPFRCIAGAVGSLEPLKDPRFIAPFCVREFAIICCARCACWLNGCGVYDGLLCEKKCWLFRFAVRAIDGETLPCKRPRLLRVGATGRRPVIKLA